MIEFQLTKLQQSKAAGPYNLPPGLLKDSTEEISFSLGHVNTGVFPSSWKIAKVTPVNKSGAVNEI